MNQQRIDLILQKLSLDAVQWYFDREELKFIKDSIQELSQLREEKRLTNNMVKFVVCIKCNRHRTPYGFYPNKPCECGSHESEERDTTLEELFAESQELSKLRPIVQALEPVMKFVNMVNKSQCQEPKEPNCIFCNIKKLDMWKALTKIESILASSEVKQ